MTLTEALRAALSDPSDLTPLRAMMSDNTPSRRAQTYQLAAAFVLCGLGADTAQIDQFRAMILVLGIVGWPADTCRRVLDGDRSPEWTAAAERLAAWADGVVA